jgi:regulator of sigma E protease
MIITILAFLFVLGVLIFVHESGHFLMARWHGVRVITFSLGFGPKLLKYKSGEPGSTEYCVSIVPLGGYVKLAGETVEEERTGAPDEFLSKSKWVRFQVYLMGPVMNILLAIVLLAAALYRSADVPIYPTSPAVIGQIAKDSPAERAGLKVGDRVIRVAGRDVPTWDDFQMDVLTKANREIALTIVRDSQTMDVKITPASQTKYELGDIGVGPVWRPQVFGVNAGSPAERAGMLADDVILAVNGEQGIGRDKIIEQIKKHPKQALTFTMLRAGQTMDVMVTPDDIGGSGVIGAFITYFEIQRITPGFFRAITMSVQRNWDSTKLIGRTLSGLFTAETPVKQLMGPVAIAEMSGSAARLGWIDLFGFMAMISLNLGLINLMPIPVMDGGQITILAIEGISRRDFSMKVKERILMAGFAFIVVLMVTVIYNDVARLLR